MKQFLLILILTFAAVAVNAQDTCNQTISGEVRDKISTDVLVDAEVVLIDENGTVLQTQTIKEDGFFSFTINCETKYTLEGKKEEFTAESKTFTTTDQNGRVLQLIILLDKGNIDFVTDGAANAKTIDSVATAEVEMPKSQADIVAENIEKPEMVEEVTEETKMVEDVVEEKEVPVKKLPQETKVENADRFATNINPVYFDYESSWLNQKAKNDLRKIVTIMQKNPAMVIECRAHTDAKGDVKYNQWMSDRRAKRVIDYIVSRGIGASRISGKGYEEKYIINKCTNDVECTDEERAANRRVEFVIVKM